jgi:hypothetical protein
MVVHEKRESRRVVAAKRRPRSSDDAIMPSAEAMTLRHTLNRCALHTIVSALIPASGEGASGSHRKDGRLGAGRVNQDFLRVFPSVDWQPVI